MGSSSVGVKWLAGGIGEWARAWCVCVCGGWAEKFGGWRQHVWLFGGVLMVLVGGIHVHMHETVFNIDLTGVA